MKPKLLYTITEAASELGIGRTRMYELLRDSQINIVRLGKRAIRVPHAELTRYIAEQQTTLDIPTAPR